jgi:prophage regulatory protein
MNWLIQQETFMSYEEENFATNRIVRIKDVLEITNFSRTKLWRLRVTGFFPKCIKLSSSIIGWYESDIYEWLNSLPRGV